MAKVVVRSEDVRKRFVIRRGRAQTWQEAAMALVRGGAAFGTRDEFWALNGVSFEVEAGRTMGIIGRNGAGKSTLLKLLAGTMQPTSGRLTAHGKVFGLLELAAGFHPDLSGRENVFLNGSFLGRSRADMARRLDEIVEFSELGDFIDQPVKHYSSGMYMRLGFAVALSVEPDILIVDEVLAVGDAAFRQKCLAALAKAKSQGRTILFVTHDAGAVRRFCDDAIWLERGQVQAMGPALDVLRAYLATTATHEAGVVSEGPPPDPYGTARGPIALTGVDLLGPDDRIDRPRIWSATTSSDRTQAPTDMRASVAVGEPWRIRIHYRAIAPVGNVAFGFGVHRDGGLSILGAGSGENRYNLPVGEGSVIVTSGPMTLAPGFYSVSSGLWLDGSEPARGDPPDHRLVRAAPVVVRGATFSTSGVISPVLQWEVYPAQSPHPTPGITTVTTSTDLAQTISSSKHGRLAGGFHGRFRLAPARVTIGSGDDEFLGPGWYPPEEWPPVIRWCAPGSTVVLTQDEWATVLGITLCRPHAMPDDASPVTVTILVDSMPIGRLVLGAALLEPYTFPIEPVALSREVVVQIDVDRPVRLDPLGTDDRLLGVAVREVWVE